MPAGTSLPSQSATTYPVSPMTGSEPAEETEYSRINTATQLMAVGYASVTITGVTTSGGALT
jgi:hypothetical protein